VVPHDDAYLTLFVLDHTHVNKQFVGTFIERALLKAYYTHTEGIALQQMATLLIDEGSHRHLVCRAVIVVL